MVQPWDGDGVGANRLTRSVSLPLSRRRLWGLRIATTCSSLAKLSLSVEELASSECAVVQIYFQSVDGCTYRYVPARGQAAGGGGCIDTLANPQWILLIAPASASGEVSFGWDERVGSPLTEHKSI